MTTLLKFTASALLCSSLISLLKEEGPRPVKSFSPTNTSVSPPKIQAAILLDVSSSMDGLIEQAKAQLWNMVSVMGKAKCNGATPQIELALYAYGSPRFGGANGYIKRLSPFTTDLDSLSKILFGLTTNGGDEYCGQTIQTAANDLAWDTAAASYKVIFIAGNENFLQGTVYYTEACAAAGRKGILVNTIYCGEYKQGLIEHWNLGGECGGGDYTAINQNAKEQEIPTPYDSSLMVLNTRLNKTYIGYGSNGVTGYVAQGFADNMTPVRGNAFYKRVSVKSNKSLYKNSTWDLVDAADKDGDGILDKFDKASLPDSLKKLSTPQLKEYVKKKSTERNAIQTEITNVSVQREAYITAERKKRATTNNHQTLETETEKLIKAQAKKFNMLIE